jgi:hypothetical protein
MASGQNDRHLMYTHGKVLIRSVHPPDPILALWKPYVEAHDQTSHRCADIHQGEWLSNT